MSTAEKSAAFDPADYLDSPQAIAEFVNAALEENDEQHLLNALGVAARATQNMSALARDTQLSRETLYKALSLEGNPRFNSLTAVLRTLGLTLSVRPMHPPQQR